MFDKKKYAKEYREKNRDDILEKSRNWKKKNLGRLKKQNKIYREKNIKKISDYNKKYREENPDKIKLQRKRYNQSHKIQRAVYAKKRYWAKKSDSVEYLKKSYQAIHYRIKHKKNYQDRICDFSLGEFILFALADKNFCRLFQEWVASDFNINKSPSVDRIDNSGDYTFKNIQFLTLLENSKKSNK